MGRASFIDLCMELEKISLTTNILEIQAILTICLREKYTKNTSSLIPILYLSTATVYQEYLNKELGI